MERGIYFDGWFKNNHCYHPSLPLRSLQMIEDLEKYHGTILVWSAMGGGSISLPYLHNEAFGPVDPRMRFYGYMNDSEFVAECNKRGIKVFAIVFEVQGWEFPAVIDEATGEIKRLNLHAEDDENHGWYGLREFSQGKHQNTFATKLSDYYPNGIINSDGEVVTDLFEESAARKLNGEAVHAQWVEVKNHAQICYQTCRNNPVWRDYLKKIMEIQIDAGVPGVQLDECELPITSIGSGGCFCKDCVKQFREYLLGLKAEGKLSNKFDGIDLATFNYKDYLNSIGSSFPGGAPFYEEYYAFQLRAVKKYFAELVDYAKDYAKAKYNRDLLVSGNFFNLMPVYYPMESKVDVLITEMEHTLFRQPHFYRYYNGFANGKPIIVAENPYGGIIPNLLKMLDAGKAYDLYRIFLMEASVYGCNMSIPYGGWMGNTIKDAFYPPRELTAQVQDFLYDHEDFFPKAPTRGAAVLCSFKSGYWWEGGGGGNGMQDKFDNLLDLTTSDWFDPDVKRVPFWEVIRELSYHQAMYDIKMMPDDDLRPDDFALAHIKPYDMIVLPDCHSITDNQKNIILQYAKEGGRVLVYERLAEGTDLAAELAKLDKVVFVKDNPQDPRKAMDGFLAAFDSLYAEVSPVVCSDKRVGLQRFDKDGRTFVHLLNYGYSVEEDKVAPLPSVSLAINGAKGDVKLYTLDGNTPEYTVEKNGDTYTVTMKNVPVYVAVVVE